MTNSGDHEILAKEALQAIDQRDAARLRALLEQGAPPDGWWDPKEAAERHRHLKEEMDCRTKELISSQAAEAGIADWTEEILENFDDVMGEMFGDHRSGPMPHEIPLHAAAARGSIECIELLLGAGADVNKRDYSDETALFCATTPLVVAALVKAGIDVSAVNRRGHDALQDRISEATSPDDDAATIESDLAVCEAMLDGGVPLQFRSWDKSRLSNAAFAENLHGVKFLLEAGHPIDADAGHNALHAICWHWDYSDERDEITRAIVRTLLEAGFDPNAKGDGGNTPMHEALSGDGSNLVAAEELLAAGADINATNDDGQTPLLLSYETLFDYGRVVPFMLDRGANPLIRDKHGQTVIDAARRMIAGDHPLWRIEMCKDVDEGCPPCGWKDPATPGDVEYQMLELLERAAQRFTK